MTRVEIGTLATGTRVRDRFARVGTVHRESFAEEVGNPVHRHMPVRDHVGVLWDGGNGSIIEYPDDKEFWLIEGERSEAAS
jgi:hypothetical protein